MNGSTARLIFSNSRLGGTTPFYSALVALRMPAILAQPSVCLMTVFDRAHQQLSLGRIVVREQGLVNGLVPSQHVPW